MDTEKERQRLNKGIELLYSIDALTHRQEEDDYWFAMSVIDDRDVRRYKSRKNGRERVKGRLKSKYNRIIPSNRHGKY